MVDPNETPDSLREEASARLRRIRDGLRITKITCTRAVKSRNGDSFVGFYAAWQSVQDDVDGDVEGAETNVYAEQGLSLRDAKLARYLLSMECDIAALESALANGGITSEYFTDAVTGIKHNYEQLLLRELGILPKEGRDVGGNK